MRRSGVFALAAVMALALAVTAPAGADSQESPESKNYNARTWKAEHGYLPLNGVDNQMEAKRRANEWAQQHQSNDPTPPWARPALPALPVKGVSWKGISQQNVSPPDPNGAIGPNSYLETVNQKMALYTRTGTLIHQATFAAITGHSSDADPMALWDPHTQRFYYNVWNTANATMDFGFSKSVNPQTVTTGFCHYTAGFGYPSSSFPDYPKLGQTRDFLLIGVNFYPTPTSQEATSADLLWISKPQGTGTVTTCPPIGNFTGGKFTGLTNENGTETFTPTPAIQTDPSSTGYVVSGSDIECPPICGTGALITVFSITATGSPPTPVLSAPDSINVGTYQSPANAEQPGTNNLLDTLDGRVTHAVSGFNPLVGATTVWTAHTVLGGAGAMIRWYEINPTAPASLAQPAGTVSEPNVYAFNVGMSNDRTCTATQCAHGSAMVLGFNASSSSIRPAIVMVSKIGAAAQSGYVAIRVSGTSANGFTCTPVCRWGDYGGATPDPAAALAAATGKVWLSQQYTSGGSFSTSGDQTQNWEATP
jgi:hypothetical protein